MTTLGQMRLVAFDLETTGLDGRTDRIIEFCFIELDSTDAGLKEVGRWTEVVDPGMPIPHESVKIHGITDDMVRGRPAFAHYASRIQAFVQDAVLLGHNVRFDIEFLSRELGRAGQAGLRPNHPCIDTQRVEATVNSHSLAATYARYHGKPFDGAHRSAADTQACIEVFRAQRTQHAAKLPPTLEGLLTAELDRAKGRDEMQWLDFGRKLYLDGKGLIRFGRWSKKHADKSLDEVAKDDLSYLQWMTGPKGDFDADVKSILTQFLTARGLPTTAPPSATQSSFR